MLIYLVRDKSTNPLFLSNEYCVGGTRHDEYLGKPLPPVCVIGSESIKKKSKTVKDRMYWEAGAAMHELGHGIGMSHGCGGVNKDKCIMTAEIGIPKDYFESPVFCEDHLLMFLQKNYSKFNIIGKQ